MAKKAMARISIGWPNSSWNTRPLAYSPIGTQAASRVWRPMAGTRRGAASAWKVAMITKDTSIQPAKPCSVSPNQPPSGFSMIQALSTYTKYGSAPRSKVVTIIAASQAVSAPLLSVGAACTGVRHRMRLAST